MADGFIFTIFKDTILKKVDLVFPDRSVQFKELEKLLKSTQTGPTEEVENDAIPPHAASLLMSLLRLLMEIQSRNAPPTSKASVESMMGRIGDFLEKSLPNLSPLVLDQLHSITTQIFAHCICHLVYLVHMDIYRHADRLDRMIEYWSERATDGKKWWYLVEKTPLFWARYFGLYKVGHQIPHPETEVALRVAWLKRMKLALQYFLGRSHYTLTLCLLRHPEDVEKLMATMKLDIENLEDALREVFTVPGVVFENDDIEKQSDFSSVDQVIEAGDGDAIIQSATGEVIQKLPNSTSSTASQPASSPDSNAETEPKDAIRPKKQGKVGGLISRMAEHLSPVQAVLATSRPVLQRAMTSLHLERSVLDNQAVQGAGKKAAETDLGASTSSAHSVAHPMLPSLMSTVGVKSPRGKPDPEPQSDSNANFSNSSPQAHADHLTPPRPTHSVQRVVVENLDGNLTLTAPAVDEMVQEYRNLEFSTRLHRSRVFTEGKKRELHRRSKVRNLKETMEEKARKTQTQTAASQSASHVGLANETGGSMEGSYAQSVGAPEERREERKREKFDLPALEESEDVEKVGDEEGDQEGEVFEWMKERRREVERLAERVANVVNVVEVKMKQNDIPAVYERQWMMCCVVGVLSLYGGVKVVKNWAGIKMAILSTKDSILKFLNEHAYQPLVSIWKTIRYEEMSEVGVMTKENLENDVESLVRMVQSFHLSKNQSPLSHEESLILAERARSGVIPSIMTSYENEISNPIRNALMGDLLQLALIQVQKQKVDIEKAMAQLDRLLKQNQINFQLLALLPSAIFFSLSSYLTTHYYFHRDPYQAQHRLIRSLLRHLAKIINQSHPEAESLLPSSSSSIIQDIISISDYPISPQEADAHTLGFSSPHQASSSHQAVGSSQNQGFQAAEPMQESWMQNQPFSASFPPTASDWSSSILQPHHFGSMLCILSLLVQEASYLPDQERIGFLEDLAELSRSNFSTRQRLATIQRMYNNYKFLNVLDS
jgi:hypothetical protein